MSEDMLDVGLLLIAKECLNCVASALKTASEHVKNRLYIKIVPALNFDEVKSVRDVYLEASKVCLSLDVRIILDSRIKRDYNYLLKVGDVSMSSSVDCVKPYQAVVLGGTFDSLHNGHKVLLSAAILAATKRIVCGVTYGEQNKKKCLWELMQPLDARISLVEKFVEDVSNVVCETHPIIDAFGPSIVDPDLQAIIVSEETVKGGEAVNRERIKRNLSVLDVKIVSLVSGADYVLKETKISSSSSRRALLGSMLRPLKTIRFPKPFVIGLTGGIASGKSNVARILKENGCEIIDCDKLAHSLYEKGSELANKIGETFGTHLLTNGTVDRKALGRIVFADKEKLKLLNSIVWPSLKKRVQDIVANSKADFVIIDAAILLEAEWDKSNLVHQVWSLIIPPEEAVKRAMKRDNLTEKEAERRVLSQIDNSERVRRSDVVLCSLWDYEETERQVKKAFSHLQLYANQSKS